MELLLLGTGASDGIPAFFADSPVSDFARAHRGKDVRTRASALLDGCIQIDCGPDLFTQCLRERIDSEDWTALVFTHSHEDHCTISELQYGLIPFTERESLEYPIYCNAMIRRLIEERYPDWPIEIVETHSFQSYTHAQYTLTPIAANHKEDEDSQNLIFQKDGKSLLYGTDTGVWFEPTWEFLRDYTFDLLILECTDGFHPSGYHGHLSLESAAAVLDRLHSQGTLDSASRVVTTHHSHLGGATHAQLEQALKPLGAEPGFDGMRISF